jgi:hypothetical protein
MHAGRQRSVVKLARELTFPALYTHSFALESGTVAMTKKKYEAPVLRKAGKLSSLVAGGQSKQI